MAHGGLWIFLTTQAADNQCHMGAILQRGRRRPHPETTDLFRQGAPGARHGFRRGLRFNCNCLIQHEVKMRRPSPLGKRLLVSPANSRFPFRQRLMNRIHAGPFCLLHLRWLEQEWWIDGSGGLL